MKAQRKLIALGLAIVLLLASAWAVLAVPPLPSSFHGTVQVNGANVPVGTTVSAWINKVKYAETTASLYAGDTVYSLVVEGDDPQTSDIVEGGRQGDTVVFCIGDHVADQTASWQSGTSVRLDLTYNVIFLPWVAKHFAAGVGTTLIH